MTRLTDSFSVTGGETKRAPINAPSYAFSPSERKINIRTPYSVSSVDQWTGQKVWLLVPGFTNSSDYFDQTLSTGINLGGAINNANPNDAILALDWTQVSGSLLNNGAAGIIAGDLYRSASWITPVANAVRDKLISWGMPAAALNIVGNSLGTHLAGEIAASFSIYGSQVGSVTALDPASNTAKIRSPYDGTNGYDTDLSNGYINNGGIADPIKRLDIGVAASRSFNGISSLAGNEPQSGTAKESFLLDFGTNPNDPVLQLAQHARVVTSYINLVTTDTSGNSRLATNILGLNDTLADHQFRPDFYKGDFPNSVQVHEGVISVDAQNNPLFLVAAKLNGGINDRFIYGTNIDDELIYTGTFAKYYNNNGNHTYYLGNGNDTVYAGTGNDTIYGGNGNDILNGGDGDNTIYGEAGNDFLTAGIGNDILDGGGGNDTIYGGAGNDTIFGGDGDNQLFGEDGNDYIAGGAGKDIIYGGAGKDTIFGGAGDNTLYGEAGDDILVGGSGINRLRGGLGNDILQGGTGQNSFRGSETNLLSIAELDILIGNSSNGAFDSFWIGDGTKNWYSSSGVNLNDYAEIQNFDPAIDIILGGVNIKAANDVFNNQTLLISGTELIAKIDGLWVGNPNFQFPSI